MIQTEGITKSFGALQVLKGIDLTINKGEVVAIVGPSGAGKTTLLQIIGTLDAPDSGRLVINGTETRRLGDKELAAFRNRNIGFVFQFHQLLPEFTALENVMIPALIAKEKSAIAEKRAKEMLDCHNRMITNLVSAMAQKNILLTEKIEHMSQRTTRKKLLSYLSAQAQKTGKVSFTIPFNRQELADYLSVDRSAMSAELSRLKEENILDYHKNYFIFR